jgi:sugar phosphate isomerase/epimerase
MFQVGLNPYGLTYHLGLQGHGTPRANAHGVGMEGFIAVARELGARSIELHNGWLVPMSDAALADLRARLADLRLTPIIAAGLPQDPPESVLRSATALGAKIARLGLTRILCGDRSAHGEQWPNIVADVRRKLLAMAPLAERAGVVLAIENHQDFTSGELLAFCEEAGANVGICYDTGNSFPVAEAPLEFTRRIAARVRHVHLKDYRAQWTDEGYRLVRCAIGDGAVPFPELLAILGEHHDSLTASLEPGALEFRHVRLLTQAWWTLYPPVAASAFAACLAAARYRRLPEDADVRTPWERGEQGAALVEYELAMIRRSAANMRAIGAMT